MGSRLKEDEKNERVIRGLLKQPANRKCINCNILGPQYVCTTFSTFVCTTCSGIHREFTHRVKSISMSKFTPQEIASLQAEGNERAREIYFKEWDTQHHSVPDSSNVDRLRDFIKHVYVDRRYTGERSNDRPQQMKMGDKEEINENRRSDVYQSGSQSPPYDDIYECRYSDRSSPGYDVRRSPGYDQDNQRHSNYGRSPISSAPSGVVNDWRREDRFANGRKSEDCRSSVGESKHEIRSPGCQKDSNLSSPPVVRPVREILGENVMPLRISEPPRASSSRIADGSTFTQRTASSSSLASSSGTPAELTREVSLIDFDAETEPSPAAATAQATQPTTSQSAAQSASAPSDDNWACFDDVPGSKVTQAPPSLNPLESIITQLSAPTTAYVGQPAAPQLTSSFLSGSSIQGLTGNPVAQSSQIVSTPATQTMEVKSSGRKELPVDLFTASYSVPYQASSWQVGGLVRMEFQMQYNPAMSMPTFPRPTKSLNPFDANSEAARAQAAAFPSMSSLHAALPNIAAPGGLFPASNLGTAAPSWMPSQSPSHPKMPPRGPSFGSAMPGTYMGQLLPGNMMPSRPQGFGSFGSDGAGFGSLNQAATTLNPSLGGNPFG